MSDDIVHVMLDANSLMHFQRPDQVDWLDLLKCQSVNIVVTPILIRELEEQKVKNRSRKLRDRAQGIITWIAAFVESNAPLEIRKNIKLSFVRDKYVAKLRAWKKSALLATAFRVRLENEGNAVATDIRVQMNFPQFALAVRLRDPPSVPSMFADHWMEPHIDASSEVDPSYSDDHDNISFEINSLVHNRTFESEPVFLRFASEEVIQNFSSDYIITYIEALEPIRGALHFTVQDWIASK